MWIFLVSFTHHWNIFFWSRCHAILKLEWVYVLPYWLLLWSSRVSTDSSLAVYEVALEAFSLELNAKRHVLFLFLSFQSVAVWILVASHCRGSFPVGYHLENITYLATINYQAYYSPNRDTNLLTSDLIQKSRGPQILFGATQKFTFKSHDPSDLLVMLFCGTCHEVIINVNRLLLLQLQEWESLSHIVLNCLK